MISSSVVHAAYASNRPLRVREPTGPANASSRHERNAARRGQEHRDPAVVVTLHANAPSASAYTREGRLVDSPQLASVSDAVGVGTGVDAEAHFGDGARLQVNARGDATEQGSILLGDDARLHVNRRGDAGGSYVLEDGASVLVDQRGDQAGGSTLIAGDESRVHINARGDVAGGGTLIIGDNANLHVNTRGDLTGGRALVVGENANVHLNARGDLTGGGALAVGENANVHLNARADVATALATHDDTRTHIRARIEAAMRGTAQAVQVNVYDAQAATQTEKDAQKVFARVGKEQLLERYVGARAAVHRDPRFEIMRQLVETTLKRKAAEPVERSAVQTQARAKELGAESNEAIEATAQPADASARDRLDEVTSEAEGAEVRRSRRALR